MSCIHLLYCDKSHYQKFEIPDTWVWTTLGEIFSMQAGKSIHSQDLSSFSEDCPYPCYGGNGIRGFLPIFSHQGTYPIIGRQGALCGNINIAQGPFYATEHAVVVESFANTNTFLWAFFLEYLNLNQYATSTAQPGLSVAKIEEVPIPLPPIEEQERIVSKIHKWFGLIEHIGNTTTSLLDTISLTKSKILDLAMQGKLVPQEPSDEPAADMLRRINPKAKIITDNPHYPQLPDNWVLTSIDSVCDYGYSENVNVDEISLSEWILELEDIEKDSGLIVAHKSKKDRTVNGVRHRFVKGDVLYSKLRTYLNKVLVATEDGYCTTEIIPIKSYSCIIPEYLCAWLRSPSFLSYTAECCYGVKMPRLSTTDARKGIVPLPPLNEQKRIIEKLSKISELLSSLYNSID